MSQPTNSNGQYVRRVTLPSGRSIEVVYFEALSEEHVTAPAHKSTEPIDELHVCPECDRDLVYPVDWEEASATHWAVVLRCPLEAKQHFSVWGTSPTDLDAMRAIKSAMDERDILNRGRFLF